MGVTQVLNWMVRMATELETSIVAVERVDEYSKDIKEERPDYMAQVAPDWPKFGEIAIKNLDIKHVNDVYSLLGNSARS